jgi:sugar lactone lactonase YvrE
MSLRAGLVAVAVLLVASGGSGAAAPPQPRIAAPGPLALTRDSRALLVVDRELRRVVRIDLRTRRRTVVASGFPDAPVGITHHHVAGMFVAAAERVYHVERGRKVVVAGTGRRSHTGDGGPATAATFGGIVGIDVDFDRNLLVAEYDNWIRVVDARGGIRTVAGNGSTGRPRDRSAARGAPLGHPHDVQWRHEGVLLIADTHNGAVRSVSPDGRIATFASGFAAPIALEAGHEGTVLVADGGRGIVYRLSADGRRRTVVARADGPIGVAADERGTVFVSELEGRKRVLQVSLAGRVTVLAAGALGYWKRSSSASVGA